MELAVATGIAPSLWACEDDPTLATAITVLNEQAEAVRRGG